MSSVPLEMPAKWLCVGGAIFCGHGVMHICPVLGSTP